MRIHPNNKHKLVDKEALFWHKKEGGIQCVLCPHNCLLKSNEIGICRTRLNKEGSLLALTYGHLCAIHIDHIEKKPLYHYLPGSKTLSIATVGCNLRCLNCQNHSISQAGFELDSGEYVNPYQLIELAKVKGCDSISYTYTDPIVYYEYALDCAKLAHENGLKNVIVSAGYIHKKPLREWCKVMDAANIDLKCFSDDIYQSLSQVNLKPVLQSLETILEEGVWLEITNLVIPGYTDDLKMIKDMCRWLILNGFSKVPIHFSRFHPTHKLKRTPSTSLNLLREIYALAKDVGMEYVYLGNVTQPEYNYTYCPDCNSTVIKRNQYLTDSTKVFDMQCVNCGTVINGIWK